MKCWLLRQKKKASCPLWGLTFTSYFYLNYFWIYNILRSNIIRTESLDCFLLSVTEIFDLSAPPLKKKRHGSLQVSKKQYKTYLAISSINWNQWQDYEEMHELAWCQPEQFAMQSDLLFRHLKVFYKFLTNFLKKPSYSSTFPYMHVT